MYFHLAGPVEMPTRYLLPSHLELKVKLITQMHLQFLSSNHLPAMICSLKATFKRRKMPEARVRSTSDSQKTNIKL